MDFETLSVVLPQRLAFFCFFVWPVQQVYIVVIKRTVFVDNDRRGTHVQSHLNCKMSLAVLLKSRKGRR